MSEEKKDGPEAPPLKELTKEHFNSQVKQAETVINQLRGRIQDLQDEVQRQVGIISYINHILKTFKVPEKVEGPKKTELEVK